MAYLKKLKQALNQLVSDISVEQHLSMVPFVAFIFGIVVYFGLPFEPNLPIIIGCCIVLAGCCFIPCHRLIKIFLIYTPLLLFLGLLNTTIHTSFIKTRFLPHAIRNVEVTGFVQQVETKINKTVIDIIPSRICTLNQQTQTCDTVFATNELPRMIRLNTYQNNPVIQKGDIISGHVKKLTQPSPPVTPFGYYQARALWFEGIGAVGSISDIRTTPSQTNVTPFESFRHTIHDALQTHLSEENAGIAEALILGNTNHVPTTTLLLYRTLGLTHILSVSGFHIGLIAFLIYTFIRGFFSLLPEFVSFILIKRLALITAICGSAFYVILAGAQAPAIRSFIMITLLFLGMFFDKRVISLRNVFIACVLMLCWKPYLILSVSFQLSFTAVACLTGICCHYQKHLNRVGMKPLIKLKNGFLMMILLNICITIATAPIVAYSFHQIQTYAIIGNMMLSFIFAFLIMPILFICVLLIHWPIVTEIWHIADALLTSVTIIGMPIAEWPHAILTIPYFHIYGLVCWIFGLIGFILFQSKIRWLFIGVMSLLAVSFFHIEKPYAVIGGGGSYIGVFIQNQYHVTESYFYPQWHTSFLLYQRQTPDKTISVPIREKYVQIGPLRYAWDGNTCQKASLNLYRNGMENCPHLVTIENMMDWHTLIFYPSVTKNSETHLRVHVSALTDNNRPWRLNVPPLNLLHKQLNIEQ